MMDWESDALGLKMDFIPVTCCCLLGGLALLAGTQDNFVGCVRPG